MRLALLLALAACHNDKSSSDDSTYACPAERRVTGVVTGATAAATGARIAAIDASNWRFGDAVVVSDVVSPDPSTGEYTVCLDETVTYDTLYAKAFVAAWVDLDGDDRYDILTEKLCDEPAGGAEMEYLYYFGSTSTSLWSVGVDRTALADASYNPRLDGDQCGP